jgi:5-methylcytosine-specific restriction endonuclease McrA
MTNASVLVLNKNFQPIHITSARRAVSLLYLGVARAIDEQFRVFDFQSWSQLTASMDHEALGTVGSRIRVPRVIVLQIFDRLPRTKVRFSRHNIYMRDGNRCQYCSWPGSRTDLNLDHVLPRAQGGRTSWENVVCCCIKCNLKKGARTPEQANMKLAKKPERPRWTPTFRAQGDAIRYREWLPFLDVAAASYWNVELHD